MNHKIAVIKNLISIHFILFMSFALTIKDCLQVRNLNSITFSLLCILLFMNVFPISELKNKWHTLTIHVSVTHFPNATVT
jgi:hypothetical protein